MESAAMDDEAIGAKTDDLLHKHKSLKALVFGSKGAPNEQIVDFIKTRLPGTKLIFVVGVAGTGKSTLVKELTGINLTVGETIYSGTRNYQVCPALIHGEHYLFVDTTGFGAHDVCSKDVHDNIMDALDTFGTFLTVAGVIVVCDQQARLLDNALTTFQWVKCFCGPKMYRAITIAVTKWDGYSDRAFKKRWETTQTLLRDECVAEILAPPRADDGTLYEGGVVYHHGLPAGKGDIESCADTLCVEEDVEQRSWELHDMIRRRYGGIRPPDTLQVCQEMADGVDVHKTEADKVLRYDPHTFQLHIDNGRVVLVHETESSREASAASSEAGEEDVEDGRRLLIEQEKRQEDNKPDAKPSRPRDQSWLQRLLRIVP